MKSPQSKRLLSLSMILFLTSSALALLVASQLDHVAPLLTLPPVSSRQPASSAARPHTTPAPTPTIPPQLARSVIYVTIAHDTFQQPDHMYWKSMDNDSVDWKGEGWNNAAFSIQGHRGIINGDGNTHTSYFDNVSFSNSDTMIVASVDHFPGGTLGILQHRTDADTWYGAYIDGKQLVLEKSVHGQKSRLATQPFPADAGVNYALRFRCVENFLAVRAWPVQSAEPKGWQIIVPDATIPYGNSGIYVTLAPGNRAAFTEFIASGIAS